MSAERLREAAALMRSRAEAADHPDSWRVTEAQGGNRDQRRTLGTFSLIHNGATEIALVRGFSSEREPIAQHIASWHPAVALAVADLIEDGAKYLDFLTNAGDPAGDYGKFFLAVANAYLGESTGPGGAA